MAGKKPPSRSAKSAKNKRKSKTPRAGKRIAKPSTKVFSRLGPEPARLQAELRESIKREIDDRMRTHQREMVRLRAAMAAQPKAPQPLTILSHGDSWLNYPLNGI